MPIVAQWEGNSLEMEQNAYTSGTADMVSRTYIALDEERVDKKEKCRFPPPRICRLKSLLRA